MGARSPSTRSRRAGLPLLPPQDLEGERFSGGIEFRRRPGVDLVETLRDIFARSFPHVGLEGMSVELAARHPGAAGDSFRFMKDRIGYGNGYLHEPSMTPTYHRVKRR